MGVMLDDVAAGIYSCIVMHIAFHPMILGTIELFK